MGVPGTETKTGKGPTLIKRISIAISLPLVLAALLAGAAFAANLTGTNGPDTIRGTAQADFIKGFGGNDKLYGNLGNDTIYGADGNDQLFGHPGNDLMSGGMGDDYLSPGPGRDEVQGSGGNDRIVAFRDESPDFINCGAGDRDVADVQADDVVDGTRASNAANLVGTTLLTCERIVVNGIVVVDNGILVGTIG